MSDERQEAITPSAGSEFPDLEIHEGTPVQRLEARQIDGLTLISKLEKAVRDTDSKVDACITDVRAGLLSNSLLAQRIASLQTEIGSIRAELDNRAELDGVLLKDIAGLQGSIKELTQALTSLQRISHTNEEAVAAARDIGMALARRSDESMRAKAETREIVVQGAKGLGKALEWAAEQKSVQYTAVAVITGLLLLLASRLGIHMPEIP